MNKAAVFVIITLLLSFNSFSQETIENPAIPVIKDAGNIFELLEVMRIRDDGKEIVFDFPYGLKIGPDNGIYFYNDWMLYKFDEQGTFIFKIIEQGQGPGEATRRTNYFFSENEIFVQAGSPPKIMRFDFSGKYLGEKKTELTKSYSFLEYMNNKIYAFKDEILELEAPGTGYFDFPYNLYEISVDFDSHMKKYTFPLIHYVYHSSAWWPRARFIYAFKNNSTIYVVHTPEYKIIEFDLEKNKINKIIEREYKRIKYVPPKDTGIPKPPPNAIGPPEYEYYQDVQHMLVHEDQLWVFTSTRDNEKRRLIDVYNMEGKYIENFYIEFPEHVTPIGFGYGNVVLNNEYIYSIDEHKDGFFSIAKYKLGK